jgi:hypothetical protein
MTSMLPVVTSATITLVYVTLLVTIANHQSLLALRWTPVAQAIWTLTLERDDQEEEKEEEEYSRDRIDDDATTTTTTDKRNSHSTAGQAVLEVATRWIAPRPWLRAFRQTLFVWSLLNLPISVTLAIHLMGSALSTTSDHVHSNQHAFARLRSFLDAACTTDTRVTLPCLVTGIITAIAGRVDRYSLICALLSVSASACDTCFESTTTLSSDNITEPTRNRTNKTTRWDIARYLRHPPQSLVAFIAVCSLAFGPLGRWHLGDRIGKPFIEVFGHRDVGGMQMLAIAACAGLAGAWVSRDVSSSSSASASASGMQGSTHQGVQTQLRHAILSATIAVVSVSNLVFVVVVVVVVHPRNVSTQTRTAVLWFATFLSAMMCLDLQRKVLMGRTSHATTTQASFDYSLPPVHNAREDEVAQLTLMGGDLGEQARRNSPFDSGRPC